MRILHRASTMEDSIQEKKVGNDWESWAVGGMALKVAGA